MKERDDHDKIQTREVVKRSSNNGLTRPFKTVRKREEVNMEWVRVSVSSALPMRFFDNTEFWKTVLMTAECGENYIRTFYSTQ